MVEQNAPWMGEVGGGAMSQVCVFGKTTLGAQLGEPVVESEGRGQGQASSGFVQILLSRD